MHFFFFFLILDYKNNLIQQDLGLLCTVTWRVWFSRNRCVHGSSPLALEEIVHWSVKYHGEFSSANSVAISRMFTAPPGTRWTAAAYNCFKINTDAAIGEQLRVTGLGIVIRDHNGAALVSSAQYLGSAFPVHLAEAIGVLRGLLFAKDSGLLPATLESDALGVVKVVNSAPTLADLGLIILDIQNVLSLFPGSNVVFVPRLANEAAHILTEFAMSVEDDCLWMEDYPPFFVSPCYWTARFLVSSYFRIYPLNN
ncbi:hypothetical protein ACOSQ3_014336 [Xanthoceras sorbifolium]